MGPVNWRTCQEMTVTITVLHKMRRTRAKSQESQMQVPLRGDNSLCFSQATGMSIWKDSQKHPYLST